MAGETYMRSFTRVYGLETWCALLQRVWAHQDPTSYYSGVLALFWPKIASGEQPTILGTVSRAAISRISKTSSMQSAGCRCAGGEGSGRMMNLATGSRSTLNQTFAILSELTGYSGGLATRPAHGDIRDSLADIGWLRNCWL